jgi:ABC-2 type transport system ATP-binding protein
MAVDHDLTVPQDAFFGLLGPNGAARRRRCRWPWAPAPGHRQATIFGHDVWHDPFAAKALVGVLPDGLSLP